MNPNPREDSAWAAMQRAQERLNQEIDHDLEDFEDRIRQLERWRYVSLGGLGVLMALYGGEKIAAAIKALSQ